MSKKINLLNQRFGKLIVIDESESKNGVAFWICLCDCDEVITVSASHLKSNHTQSCGCWQKERASKANIKNTRGRKYQNSRLTSAMRVWKISYNDGCSFNKFLELSQQNCHYCNSPPANSYNEYINKDNIIKNKKVLSEWSEAATFIYNGLDRIDSSKNHNENNIVPCCIICNRAKHALSLEDFTLWIDKIYNFYIKKNAEK